LAAIQTNSIFPLHIDMALVRSIKRSASHPELFQWSTAGAKEGDLVFRHRQSRLDGAPEHGCHLEELRNQHPDHSTPAGTPRGRC